MNEQSKSYIDEYGAKIWYLPSKGKDHVHRLDGPAIEDENGTKQWWVDGERHRLDGPAIEYIYGIKGWYVEGNRHRLDGPALEFSSGTKQWWVDGERHRLDGPAFEGADGTKYWYVDDKLLPTKEVETWLEENNIDLTTEEGQMAFKLRWS